MTGDSRVTGKPKHLQYAHYWTNVAGAPGNLC